ncbi:MAG: M14 family metallopeptidase [Actinomycetota bacterium]
MRRAIVLTTALIVVAALAPMARTSDFVQAIVRVKVTTPAQGSFINATFDETHVYDPGYVHILLWPGDEARLNQLGFEYEVVVPDVYARDKRALEEAEETAAVVSLPGPDRTDYRRLVDYNTEMEELAQKHPSLVRRFKLPLQSLEGRDVFGIEIAADVKQKVNDGRPTFYVDGIHHAREWPAAEYPMIFAHYLVEGFGKNPEITRLLKNERVVIVPIVNVDGFNYSREFLLGAQANLDAAHGAGCGLAHCGAYWRKNRRSYTGITAPVVQLNPDAYGVDPNRNYSYHWGGGGSNSGVPIAGTYVPHPTGDNTNRGSAPFSEPETVNVQRLILKDNVTSIVTNHTYSRLVLRPWGDTYKHAPDEKYLFDLGAKMSKAMGGYQNIKGIQLYITTGTMSEWGYGVLGVPSYTFEHGLAFHPPYTGCEADCVGEEWRGVMTALMHGAKAGLELALHGLVKGEVVDSKGNPVPAKLTITKKVPTPLAPENPLGEKSYTERIKTSLAVDGPFSWHLPASTRPVMVEAGKTDSYTLTLTAPGLGQKTLTFVLRKGQTLDLGKIEL